MSRSYKQSSQILCNPMGRQRGQCRIHRGKASYEETRSTIRRNSLTVVRDMLGYVRTEKDGDDKNRSTYNCVRCGAPIADSGALIRIDGAVEHSFVNPIGVVCNFRTFGRCTNVMAYQDLYLEHSWFSGYGWRYLLCAECSHHLGWRYDAVAKNRKPRTFFGVLIDSVEELSHAE